MGRKKLEMKQIEDKYTRQVTFSKRKAGLTKKARQLSLKCDVDVAVIIFSSNGKLYEYCSGGMDSMEHMLLRYEQRCLEEQGRPYTAQEMLDEGPSEGGPCVSDMVDLEVELTAALLHARSRKMQLMMESVSSLREQDRKLSEEKEQLEQQLQVASANKQQQKDDDGDDGGADLPDVTINQNHDPNDPPHLVTLPLFKD